MRTLYGRIFVSFWVVTILIVGGSVGLTWLALVGRGDDLPRASAELMHGAAETLDRGGEAGLLAWLKSDRSAVRDVRAFVVGPDGRELLGRPLPPFIARLLRAPDGGADPGAGVVVLPARPLPELVAADGTHYGILIRPHPPQFFGPFGGGPQQRLTMFLLALLVTGVASWLLTRSIARPVRALGTATRALAAGDLDARVDPVVTARRDELGTLARDFDAMAGRLRDLLRGRERLLRDVSHELRSPLSRMRVALGLARQPGVNAGRELGRLEGEIERLDHLIGQMLHLSRLDATARAEFDEEVDLVELVDGIARDAGFEGQGRGVRVLWQPPTAPVRVQGHAGWLASAIENVVRNAVRYTAPATDVELELELGQVPGEALIRVRDHGPGVPEEELSRIFEPFHRVAESRTRESGGDGIGLAITARALAAHGGQARAENAPGGGLAVVMTLPTASAASEARVRV